MQMLKKIKISQKAKDFSYVLIANIINLLAGLITAFVIPKFLGIDDYATFKIFGFYILYVGFLHFGFVDGIYIQYGDYDYEKIPKSKFRTYFSFLFLLQLIISLVIIVGSFILIHDYNRMVVFIFIGINVIILNLTTFFTFIAQFVKKFKVFSFITILSKIIYVVLVFLLIILKLNTSFYFVLIQTIVNLIILFVYMYYFKDIIWGKLERFQLSIEPIKKFFKIGFMVMVGSFMSMIVVGLDRLFIDRFYTLKDFALYSFAISILTLLYTLLNAGTTVLYPYLTRENSGNYPNLYIKLKKYSLIIMGLALASYFGVEFIVNLWLPKFKPSLTITLLLFPTVLLNGQISIVVSNFYKVLKLQRDYMKNNIFALAMSFCVVLIMHLIFHNVEAIAAATIISFYIWLVFSDNFFRKKIGVKVFSTNIVELILCFTFMFSAYFFNWYIGFIVYVVLYIAIVQVAFKEESKKIISIFKKRILKLS